MGVNSLFQNTNTIEKIQKLHLSFMIQHLFSHSTLWVLETGRRCINHWWFKPKHVSFGCKLWYLYPLLLAYRFTISLHTQRFNDTCIALKSPVIISLNSLSTTQKLQHQAALCQVAFNQDKNQLPCQMHSI